MKINVIALNESQAKKNAKSVLKNEGYKDIEIIELKEENIPYSDERGAKIYSVEYEGLYHQEEQINIELLKRERNEILKLYKQSKKILEQQSLVEKKLKKITKNCDHRVVVEVINEMTDNDIFVIKEANCLLCNKRFSSLNDTDEYNSLENVIHFGDIDASSSEKTDLAFNKFCQIKEENPDLSDSEVVELINNQPKKKLLKKGN
jgi:hypothetical protein